jgi:hypothetical protein
VSLLREPPPRIGDRAWRGTVVQVHRRYRFYHLLYLLPLYSNTIRTIIALHHHLPNTVKVTFIPVLVHGVRHPHHQVTTQDPYSPHPPPNYRHPCLYIMSKSPLFRLRFNTPQKTRRHGIRLLSMSTLNSHLRRILVINRLHYIRKINTMSIQPHSIQLTKETRTWYMEVQEYQGLVLGIQSLSTIIP